MKKLVALTIVIFSLSFQANLAIAHMGHMDDEIISQPPLSGQTTLDESHGQTVNEVLADILRSQGIDTVQQIDCTKIPDEQLEALGEAWMNQMHPDEQTHEKMDEMMGGEGSPNLRQAHIQMGANYLGCLGKNVGGMMGFFPMMGMMRQGGDFNFMMGPGMMGNSFIGGFGLFGFIWLITWLLIIALLISLIRYFWRKGSK